MNYRNRRFITWLIAGTLALCVVIAVAQTRVGATKRYPRIPFYETTESIGKFTLVQGAIPSNFPTEFRVYKVKPLASKKNAILKIFKALPLKSGPKTDAMLRQLEHAPESLIEKEEPLRVSIGGWRVKVWSGGQFLIDKEEPIKPFTKVKDIPASPAPEEARKAADAFLARIKPELPDPDVHFCRISPQDTYDDVVASLSVSYSAELDGIPYDIVSIGIGTGPTVTGMSCHLRRVVPDGMVPILTPQEAVEKLQAKEGHVCNGDWAAGNVTSFKIVYYNEPHMSHIMPIYIISGEDHSGKWNASVEAARPEYLEKKPAGK
ncbi:MAG: hypothetical protein ABFD54_16090 [Armatimonadota bacterium]|nr:hypothetical protein [bacterium]